MGSARQMKRFRQQNEKSRRPKPELYLQKPFLYAWWDIKFIVHYELLEHETTIIADINFLQFDSINEVLRRNSLVKWKGVILPR